MAKVKNLPIYPDADLLAIAKLASQNLTGQGFMCNVMPMGENAVSFTVAKDRNDFKNHIGMGIECRVSLSAMGGNQLMINIEDEWQNKIIACVAGALCCQIVLITGIIGCINQAGLGDKIATAIQMSIAAAQSGATPVETPNPYQQSYGNAPYQPPFQN